MPKPLNKTRRYTNPSELTEYEKSILTLRQQGLTDKQIAEKIGNLSPRSVSVKWVVIKEKLASQ